MVASDATKAEAVACGAAVSAVAPAPPLPWPLAACAGVAWDKRTEDPDSQRILCAD